VRVCQVTVGKACKLLHVQASVHLPLATGGRPCGLPPTTRLRTTVESAVINVSSTTAVASAIWLTSHVESEYFGAFAP
jgi:hypothetical protein